MDEIPLSYRHPCLPHEWPEEVMPRPELDDLMAPAMNVINFLEVIGVL